MTVIDQAENVGGLVSAARLRESFMRRQANASSEEEREALRDAIGTMELRFPELEDLPAGGAERFARERGHGRGSRSPVHEGRRRARKPDAPALEEASRRAATPKKTRAPVPAAPKRSRGSSPRPRGRGLGQRASARGRQAWRETGIPSAGASVSQIAMSLLGGTVGIAAVYLLLSSSEGGGFAAKALPTAVQGATGFLNRVIAPVDFFGPPIGPRQFRALENPASLAAEPKLHPIKHPSPTHDFHIRPAQIGFKK